MADFDVGRIAALLAADNPAAADAIDALADRLKAIAAAVRARHAVPENPWVSPGGMSDRVKIQVVGPAGDVTQSTDTGSP